MRLGKQMPALRVDASYRSSLPTNYGAERSAYEVSMDNLMTRQYELLTVFMRLDRLMLSHTELAEAFGTRVLQSHVEKLQGLGFLKVIGTRYVSKQHYKITGKGVRKVEEWLIERGELDERTGLPTKASA